MYRSEIKVKERSHPDFIFVRETPRVPLEFRNQFASWGLFINTERTGGGRGAEGEGLPLIFEKTKGVGIEAERGGGRGRGEGEGFEIPKKFKRIL